MNNATAPLDGTANSSIRLQLFLDGSLCEVFADKTTALTARIYKIPSTPLRLKIEGNTKLTALDAWQINPITKDRLTASLCS